MSDRISRITLKVWSLLLLLLIASSAMAQQKKKIRVFELDQIKGLYFQPNTIKPYSGTAFDEYPNGKKKLQIPIKEGKIHGAAVEWAQNGKKIHESHYEAGVQVDTETQWYATGQKKLEIKYVNGKPEGVCKEWHKGGELKFEGGYVNGLEQQAHIWYYPSGQKDQLIPYQDGKASGIARQWFPSGQQRMETRYVRGLKDGHCKEWYNDGNVKMSGFYVGGKEDDTFKDWSRKGRLLRLRKYAEGVLKEDHNYRNGSIRTHNGYIQVFNELESFFRVDITGQQEVAPIQSRDLTFSVDGMFLEVFIRPVSELLESGQEAPASDKALLKRFAEKEANFIRESKDFPVDLKMEYIENGDGLPYLHWHFVSPGTKEKEKKPRTVQHEHYVTMLCNKQLLNLYSVVTNSDDPESVPAMLKRLAPTAQLHNERIDLNEIVRKLR